MLLRYGFLQLNRRITFLIAELQVYVVCKCLLVLLGAPGTPEGFRMK